MLVEGSGLELQGWNKVEKSTEGAEFPDRPGQTGFSLCGDWNPWEDATEQFESSSSVWNLLFGYGFSFWEIPPFSFFLSFFFFFFFFWYAILFREL